MAHTDEKGLIDASLSATKLYYEGLVAAGFDPSGGYLSLVAAIERLAGYHYRDREFAFDHAKKFDPIKPTLERLAALKDQPAVS